MRFCPALPLSSEWRFFFGACLGQRFRVSCKFLRPSIHSLCQEVVEYPKRRKHIIPQNIALVAFRRLRGNEGLFSKSLS